MVTHLNPRLHYTTSNFINKHQHSADHTHISHHLISFIGFKYAVVLLHHQVPSFVAPYPSYGQEVSSTLYTSHSIILQEVLYCIYYAYIVTLFCLSVCPCYFQGLRITNKIHFFKNFTFFSLSLFYTSKSCQPCYRISFFLNFVVEPCLVSALHK